MQCMRLASRSLRAAKVSSVPVRNLTYTPPVRDVNFLFYEVLNMEGRWKEIQDKYNVPSLVENTDRDTVQSIFGAAGEFAVDQLLPLYQPSDVDGVKYDGKTQTVSVTKGFGEAYKAFSDAGWNTLYLPEQYGGQHLPNSINLVKTEFMSTANWAWGMFPGLTVGAMNTLFLHASEAQKTKYLPKLSSGEWSGTMCLTEPHCGTDLAQNKTRAEPIDEAANKYKIYGTKIFISCGDHEIADNIIHIVLARLPGGPPGVKGISLFIVPKFTDAEMAKPRSERTRNVVCAGVEKKMGIHGSPTCTMSFEGSEGYLIGKPHDGLRQMFTFMNTARIGVALQGVAHSEIAYQNAYKYALERRGMSPLSGKVDPSAPADAIIHLPEIKRLLLTARVVADGGRHLIYKCARELDEMNYMDVANDHAGLQALEDRVGWYTPVSKGFTTELAMEACYNAMQTLGGHGYIRDHGFEQIYRDARIATMYEGTSAVQGMDLIGRKMAANKFKHYFKYMAKVQTLAIAAAKEGGLFGSGGRHARALLGAVLGYRVSVLALASVAGKNRANRDVLTSNSVDNLFAMGYVMYAECFLEQQAVVRKALARSDLSEEDRKFYLGKQQTIDFFFDRMFPRVWGHIRAMRKPDDCLRVKDHTIMAR